MNKEIAVKLAVGLLVMIVWGGLVLHGDTDAAPYVDALKTILTGLGVYHVSTRGNS